MMTDTEILWGAAAIGRAIGKSERATYHMLERGQLPASKVGVQWVAERGKLLAEMLAPAERRSAGKRNKS
jgi:hypothetical protein